MRGARFSLLSDGFVLGIIPADAGSTLPGIAAAAGNKDHPRGCGEHDGGRQESRAEKGSSPRMRGALPDLGYSRCSAGIIPADAGSTLHSSSACP